MTISDLNSFESKDWIREFNYTKELSDSQTFYSQSFSLLNKQNTTTIINVKAIINEPGRKNKLDNEIYNERNGDSFVWISLAYRTDSRVRFLFASSLKKTEAPLFNIINALVKSGNKVSNPPDMHDIEIDENTLNITPFELLPDCPARDVKFLTIREMDEQSSWRKDSEGICAWRSANEPWKEQFERINFWRFQDFRTTITQSGVEYSVTARFEVMENASPELTLHFETQNQRAKGFKLTFYNDKAPQAFDLQHYQTPKEDSEAQKDFAKGLAILKMIQGAPKTSKGTSYPWAAITLVALACLGLYYYRQPIAHFFGYSSPQNGPLKA